MKTGLFIVLCSLMISSTLVFADVGEDIIAIQHQWARANYDTPPDRQKQAFKALISDARTLVGRYPDQAEPKIWLAISLSTDAGVNGGLHALGKVKEARKLLEAAEKINPYALNASIYTSLGSLYYQVPGWPIGFGNDDKAEAYLKKAISINPAGIDPNYFYGDFLLSEKRYAEAVKYLSKASQAPNRPGRSLADSGRRAQVRQKLSEARGKL